MPVAGQVQRHVPITNSDDTFDDARTYVVVQQSSELRGRHLDARHIPVVPDPKPSEAERVERVLGIFDSFEEIRVDWSTVRNAR